MQFADARGAKFELFAFLADLEIDVAGCCLKDGYLNQITEAFVQFLSANDGFKVVLDTYFHLDVDWHVRTAGECFYDKRLKVYLVGGDRCIEARIRLFRLCIVDGNSVLAVFVRVTPERNGFIEETAVELGRDGLVELEPWRLVFRFAWFVSRING